MDSDNKRTSHPPATLTDFQQKQEKQNTETDTADCSRQSTRKRSSETDTTDRFTPNTRKHSQDTENADTLRKITMIRLSETDTTDSPRQRTRTYNLPETEITDKLTATSKKSNEEAVLPDNPRLSSRMQTPDAPETVDNPRKSPTLDVPETDYEVYRQIFELCATASTLDNLNTEIESAQNVESEVITTKDLKMVMGSIGLNTTDADFGMLVKNAGTNGNFTLDDLVKIFHNHNFKNTDSLQNRQELWETFQYFDEDGDGFISITDLQKAIHCLGLEIKSSEIYQMVLAADKTGDCRVNFDEFEAMLLGVTPDG